MQVTFLTPSDFGNSGGEAFRGQRTGFAQNTPSAQQPSMNQPGDGNGAANGQRKRRGFASMDPARVSEIARMGGKAAHEQGVAHEWTKAEASAAGRKGGLAGRGQRNNATQQAGH